MSDAPDPPDHSPDDKPHYMGHRQRLRDRFMKGGADAMPDYELMEMVLFAAKPRGDVKPLAKDLITRFGSFAEAISADPADLKEVPGVGEGTVATLKVVREAALRLAQQQVLNRPVLSSWQALMDYCQAAQAYEKTERFRVLFLNRKNVLIADEVQQKGTVDHTPVYPREIVKRALELGATALIMVHNHPSGDPTPSRADVDMTQEVQEAGERLGITLHDHIIVSRGGTLSFKAMGYL